MNDAQIISLIRKHAHTLKGAKNEYDALMDLVGNAQIVLLGESTHGTDDFYAMRAAITLQLIEKKQFNIVALEADWPDAYRINRFIKGHKTDPNSMHALGGFKRFPQWMWRNTRMVELVSKLYQHNEKQSYEKKVSIFGLDLYSLYASIDEVLAYLDKIDPTAAQRARKRYACFDLYRSNAQQYGYATTFDISASCQQKVIEQLMDLRQSAVELLQADGPHAKDELFYAQQNAHLIKNAERYYRSLFFADPATSWNIRDTHMMETAQAILNHQSIHADSRKAPKLIIWAHNSHIGNAAATQMGKAGEINIGQLIKETYGDRAKSIGFTTYSGTVSAASDWEQPVERKQVRPALAGSFEALFHATHIPAFMLPLTHPDIVHGLADERLERAIGVIYRPQTERQSHYFGASLPAQFDAIIHCDHTKAVEPLEKTFEWDQGEMPETYPGGL